jgi:hypothetical protein
MRHGTASQILSICGLPLPPPCGEGQGLVGVSGCCLSFEIPHAALRSSPKNGVTVAAIATSNGVAN